MSYKNYYTKQDNITPFNPQIEHFDYICGEIQNENKILRTVVIVAVLSFFLSIAISIFAVTRPSSIPVLVTMNDFGETKYIGEVSRKNYQNFRIPEIAILYQVKDFLNLYHSLSLDKIVMKKSINKIYHMMTSTTASKYSTLIKEENFFGDFGSYTREVFFQTEPLKISNDTYQVDYQVVKRTDSGKISTNQKYRAVITIKTLQPTEDDINDNPLGIYITAFDIKPLDDQIITK